MKRCSLFIVCLALLAACRTPRQAATPLYIEKAVEVHDTIQIVQELWRDTGSITIVPVGNFDSIFIEMEKAWAKLTMKQDTMDGKPRRKYTVEVGNLPDTVWIPVVVTDTIRIAVDCPPTLPAMPTNGRFPWGIALAALAAILFWWVGKRKEKS